jgi:hypothetical protein
VKSLLILLFVSISAISYAQFPGTHEKKGGIFSHFSHTQKPHKQMGHFDKKKRDPYLKQNGTSWIQSQKSGYDVDGTKRHRRRKSR